MTSKREPTVAPGRPPSLLAEPRRNLRPGRGEPILGRRRESEIQRAILAYLRTVPGVVAWRQNVGAVTGEYQGHKRFVRYGFRGLVDIVGWVDFCRYPVRDETIDSPSNQIDCNGKGMYHVARFLAIEVKRPGGKPTPQQEAFLASVKDAGGLAFVATCVEDVVRELGR